MWFYCFCLFCVLSIIIFLYVSVVTGYVVLFFFIIIVFFYFFIYKTDSGKHARCQTYCSFYFTIYLLVVDVVLLYFLFIIIY